MYFTQDSDDAALVGRSVAGDAAAFETLVLRYERVLFGVALRMLGDYDEARDATQAALIKAYRKLRSFDPRYRFSTWIFRVAQNAAIDQIRRQRLRLVPMTREGGDGEDREWDFPSADPNPYADLRNRERGDAIAEAIAALPWEYRELILLRHYGELSYDEIATLKKMPLGTVKNKLFRGRQMLKEKLADFLTD